VLLAFDMFGTLADTASVTRELTPACGDRASDMALAWRGKQLEYLDLRSFGERVFDSAWRGDLG
jgi:hypothetical protein